MKKLFVLVFLLSFLFNKNIHADEKKMFLELEYGTVEIELFEDIAPNTVKRIKTLAKNKDCNNGS